MYISGHPLDKLKDEIKKLSNIDTVAVNDLWSPLHFLI